MFDTYGKDFELDVGESAPRTDTMPPEGLHL